MPTNSTARFLKVRESLMKLVTKCIPLGALPYDSIETATRMVAKLFEKMPFVAMLPKVEKDDTIVKRTLENIPGIMMNNSKVEVKITSNHYKQGMANLEKAFNHPNHDTLAPFAMTSPFMEKHFQLIKKFNSPNTVINLLGPFTLSQMLLNSAEEQMLTDKSFRKLFIQAVCVKALWAIEQIKYVNPNTVPIVMLEEPLYGKLGDIKRENEDVTVELVTTLFARVIEKLKEAGAIVGIQCLDKCDWKIPINAGVDIISFDAYNNPNNLCIIPEQITEFLERGGKINWGIVPVMTESLVKSLNIDIVSKRLFSTLQCLIDVGVDAKSLCNSSLVSIQGDVDKLPIIFAEKAIILATQLAKRIPNKN